MSEPKRAGPVPSTGVLVTDEGALQCPWCREIVTHVDFAYVAARREDGKFNEIRVNATTGQVWTHRDVPAPVEPMVVTGRRHRIAVAGYCEVCGEEFAVVFAQHKGTTYVGTARVSEPVESGYGSA